jgi:hypothetical protein
MSTPCTRGNESEDIAVYIKNPVKTVLCVKQSFTASIFDQEKKEVV